MQYPYWIMAAGAILVMVGFVGLALRKNKVASYENDPDQNALMAKGKMTMRFLIILAAICFSANAFAQDAPPKAGTKTVKPKEPIGCKFVGTVKGTELWAGDCAGPVPSGAAPATEANSPPKQ